MFAPRARAILLHKEHFSAPVRKMQPFIGSDFFCSHYRVVFPWIFHYYACICLLYSSSLFFKTSASSFRFEGSLATNVLRSNLYLYLSYYKIRFGFCFHEACFRITNFSLSLSPSPCIALSISLPFRGRMGTSDRGRIAYLRTRQNKTMWIISIPCTPYLCNMIGFRCYADACGRCNILEFPVSFSFLVPFHLARILALLYSLQSIPKNYGRM